MSWQHMIDRCYNPNSDCWEDYGGRGIIVCDRWRHDYPAFLRDMGERPRRLVIDRINNSGNYEPDNCHWVTRAGSNRNSRRNKVYTIRGITACHADLAAHFGLHFSTVSWRLRAGWSPERAFTASKRRNQFG